MNRVTKRTWMMGLFLIVLLGGMGLFCVQYLLHLSCPHNASLPF